MRFQLLEPLLLIPGEGLRKALVGAGAGAGEGRARFRSSGFITFAAPDPGKNRLFFSPPYPTRSSWAVHTRTMSRQHELLLIT